MALTNSVRHYTTTLFPLLVAVLPGFDSCSSMYVNQVFIVDVKPAIFHAVMVDLGDHIATLNLGPARTGLLTLEPDPTEQLSCKKNTQRKVANLRKTLSRLNGGDVSSVNMTSAMEFLRDMFAKCSRSRTHEVPKIATIITDRVDIESQDYVQAATTAREAEIHVITVLMGVNHSDVENMATDPRGVITTDSIYNIHSALKTAHHLLCPGKL